MSIIWKIIKKIGTLIFDVISTAGLYLTQTAREERAHKKYMETYNYYKRFPKNELNGIYINTQTAYEYKKCFYSVWLIAFAMASLGGVWKYFIQFLLMILQLISDRSMDIDILQTNALFSSIVFVLVCGIITLFLYWYICGMREMYRDLLIMKECLKTSEENE